MGLLNGSLFMFGSAFLDPSTVLPVFIKRFTDSDFIVGLAGSLQRAGWHLPQLPLAGYLERRPYKLPVYLKANAVRMSLMLAFLPILALLAVEHPSLVLLSFLLLFGLGALFGGVAGLPFTDIVGKTIPRRLRGPFYAIRFFFGAGLLSISAGFIVKHFLEQTDAFPFPQNYLWIFGIALSLMIVGIICYAFVKEPPGKAASSGRGVRDVFSEIPEILKRDVNYRQLIVSRLLVSGIGFSLPFYIVLARERFGLAEGATGVFLAMQTLGATLSNLPWGWLSSRRGNRLVIRLSAYAIGIVPLYALGLIAMQNVAHNSGTDLSNPMWLFLPIFFLMGGAMTGSFVGYNSMLLDIAPDDRRPTYIGITNTAMGGASLFPAVGGLIGDLMGLEATFLLAGISVIAGIVATRKLVEAGDGT